MNRYLCRAHAAPWRNGVEFLIASEDGKSRVVSMTCERKDGDDVFVPEPSFHLDNKGAQILLDDLWQAGFRPSDGSGNVGALRATERHLEDMRTLVFQKRKGGA